jgi:formylglycine-generating enzyme required for sulfatase activity
MHSPFADALLYRLKQNEDELGVQELCAYVVEQVQAHAQQSPIGEPLRVEGHKNGQFVFRKKVKSLATQVSDPQEAFAILGQSIGKAEAPPAPAPVVQPSNPGLVLPEMILVKGGTFMMGCTEEQRGDCFGDEKPAHQVTVKDFRIGKYQSLGNPAQDALWVACTT